MATNTELQERRSQAVAPGVASMLPVFCQRAENAELWDVEGRRYIDFASGISVLNTGHLHPRVKAAAEAQLRDFSHVSVNPPSRCRCRANGPRRVTFITDLRLPLPRRRLFVSAIGHVCVLDSFYLNLADTVLRQTKWECRLGSGTG